MNKIYQKVITSAQSFGYGPSSKLVTVAKELRRVANHSFQIDFVGCSTSMTYIGQNKKYFDNIFDEKNYPKLDEYDFAVSVMDPYLAIKCAVLKKQIIYVDSLYWFWKWNNNGFMKLEKIIKKIKLLKNIIELSELLCGIDPHELQYIAHRLSNYSIVQTFGQQKVAKNDIFRNKIHIIYVDPIIDKTLYKQVSKKNSILISLSGMISPLVNDKQAQNYVKLVCNILTDFVEGISENIEIILTTNPDVVKKIDFDTGRIKITSLSNEEVLTTLNRSIICLAPVGITFLYEALNYNVPIIFLPEQHDGHYPNYLRLLKPEQKVSDLQTIFPETLFNTRMSRNIDSDPDNELLYIQTLINDNCQNDSKIIKSMKKTLAGINFIENYQKVGEILIRQKSQLLCEVNYTFSCFILDFLKNY